MSKKKFKERSVSTKEAKRVGDRMGVDWKITNLEEFRMGLEIEQEHHDLVGNKIENWGRITLVHLQENPKYNSDLRKYVDPK